MCTQTIHIKKQKFIFDSLEYTKESQAMNKIIKKLNKQLNETKRTRL